MKILNDITCNFDWIKLKFLNLIDLNSNILNGIQMPLNFNSIDIQIYSNSLGCKLM
jgi:hypothetical protein